MRAISLMQTPTDIVDLQGGLLPWAKAQLDRARELLLVGRGLAAFEVLVAAEARTARREETRRRGTYVEERERVHAFLSLRSQTDQLLPSARRAVRFPEEARQALELEVARAIVVSRAFVDLGWFTHGESALANAAIVLGYLGERPKERFAWLRQRASWAFAARELGNGRHAVLEYASLLDDAVDSLPEGELDALLGALEQWPEVAQVRELVARLSTMLKGDAEREARLLAWDLASTLFFPWDEALESELEARLAAPTLPLLQALVDRVDDSLVARSIYAGGPPSPALLEDGERILALLDRLADLAEREGAIELAVRARTAAHEQMLDVVAVMREQDLTHMHPIDAERAQGLLIKAPWAREARVSRLSRLQKAAPRPEGRTCVAMLADPLLAPDAALQLAERFFDGGKAALDDERLDAAAALVDRSVIRDASQDVDAEEQRVVEFAARWLEAASREADVPLAMEAKEILANARELGGDLESALQLFEEVATYFEGRDHDRWVRAIERCATLAKKTGKLAAAGRAARSGFRPGGKVQAPPPSTEIPADPIEAEEQAERAIAVALRATEPEIGEAWLKRALTLYQKVPDGRRREDEIWERIADQWQAEADALFEEGDAGSSELDDAHRLAHEALVRAIEVNEDLGDGERVFELSGRVLDVLWTWLTRWEDAVDAFLSLARNRFGSAMAREDLEHAASALLELRAHLADLRQDAADLEAEPNEARELVRRFEELEREMSAELESATARLREPWWAERLSRREALYSKKFETPDR